MARGSLGTVSEGVRRAQAALGAKELIDIDSSYHKKHVEAETTRRAANDLEKYHKVRHAVSPSFWDPRMLLYMVCY